MVGNRRLGKGQGTRARSGHQWETDLLLGPGMDHEQAGEPRPHLSQARAGRIPAPHQIVERAEQPEDARVLGNDQFADLAGASARSTWAGSGTRGGGTNGSGCVHE
jgi:hypothetical protein